MKSKWLFKSLVNSSSLLIVLCTGLLEYFSHLGMLLTWGYLLGIVLTAVYGEKIHALLALTGSVSSVIFALLIFPDIAPGLVLIRSFSVLGMCLTTALVLLVIQRRTKAENFRIQMTGILSYGTQGVILTDQSGRIILVNSFVEHLFGYTKKELVGQAVALLIPRIALTSSVRHTGAQLNLTPLHIEHQNLPAIRKDNSSLPVEISLNDFDAEGKRYRVLFITDETIRRQNQEILEAQKQELEIVNKELESFSYSVSHDLRAPLRAIGGYALMLEEDYAQHFDANALRLLGNIDQNAQRMGLLIDDLLAFSRLGRKEVQKRQVNMIQLAEGSLSEISAGMKHQAQVVIGDLHAVMADPSLMSRVMTNLLSNAIKYSSRSTQPRVDVYSVRKDDSVIFSIRDNGVGFDMQYAHKLFGVFQRLHTEAEFEGTGVGLAIANRIINKHGGKIWAEGEEGRGACFSFSLPLRVEDRGTVN